MLLVANTEKQVLCVVVFVFVIWQRMAVVEKQLIEFHMHVIGR